MLRALSVAIVLGAFCLPAAPTSAGPDEDVLEDSLGGFYDEGEDDYGFEEDEALPLTPALRIKEQDEDFWDLAGDLSLGASYNYLNHNSATGTNYGNLSRLRAQLDLELDLRLPANWKARIAGYGFYDFAYVAKGRSQYTDDVLDDYEWEVDFREVWVQGSPTPSLDLKLGRQIVNWGRSDTVRVLDVINPLDNREPGLVDIEDLRLPVTMARFDYYPSWIPNEYGDWSVQFLVIPEFRQDRNPSIGNDFNPTPIEINIPSDKPDRFFDDPEYGGAITGTFSGWDVSVYGARVYLNQPLVAQPLSGLLQRHPLVTMVGAGGNLTFGSWLLKAEMGWFDGVEYNLINAGAPPVSPPTARVVDKSRLDSMGGVEYYGVSDLTIAFEVVHRHIFEFDQDMKTTLNGVQVAYAKEDLVESAFRATADFLNSRLHVTGVALLIGTHADLGSVVRLEASYDLRDALILTGGIVLYQEGSSPAFDEIGDNDRLFVGVEYSF